LHLSSCNMSVFVYQLADDEPVEEMNEEENVMTSHHLVLPSRTLEGLWESLVFDDEIQTQLLDYITTTMEFSDCAVDPNIISWNRVVLLYGPPGTGKTSLCRALAHKLSVRLSNRFAYGKLIEINSHSLFSKWFSESGKLVMKMFSTISELASDDDAFVTVLIDEVESLTAARRAAVGGSEPSDAVRVVNALLTQIDQIKKRKNVLIVTTSNVTEAIDLAFVDRADIKHYIAPPSARAVYTILCSCISELVRTGIVLSDGKLLDWKEIELFRGLPPTINPHRASIRLASVADKCAALQLSGRTLRRLPFLAHAHFVRRRGVSGEVFVEALEKALESEGIAREIMRREGERPHEGKSNAS
ncbi:AAA-domain-containing protein, partial [Gonapodya prolifera JEL478]